MPSGQSKILIEPTSNIEMFELTPDSVLSQPENARTINTIGNASQDSEIFPCATVQEITKHDYKPPKGLTLNKLRIGSIEDVTP
jgi:hypothetical protein